MLPGSWRPRSYQGLIRLGPDSDGGYVVPASALALTDVLLSLGLRDDWRFEKDFLSRSHAKLVCYDHTVNRSFWRWRTLHGLVAFRKAQGPLRLRFRELGKYREYLDFFDGERAEHRQVMVGFDSAGSTSLESILRGLKGRVFMKMDIEGWEYRVLDQLLPFEDRLLGFVVEFHDVDLHRQRISEFIGHVRRAYGCVHWHANNYGPVDDRGDPTVLEATFVHRDLPESITSSDHRLDFANCASRPDLRLTFDSVAEDG